MVAFTEQAGLLSALAQQEARRLRHHYLGAEHLLLGLLRDAQDPIEAHLYPMERRKHALLGLPNRGLHPIRLLVEARGLTLGDLRTALLSRFEPNAGHS
jgi:hypothetical protein